MDALVALFQREVAAFFNTLVAYLVVGVFLVGVGLFFWIFPGNILDTGAATLDALFAFGPWFMLFLIPAITMRSFAEEFRTGTWEWLVTRPVRSWQILLGKYAAAVFLVKISVLPTLIFFATTYYLAQPTGGVDTGAIIGAYIGLICIGAVFAAVGLFASTLTDNQIVAFVLGVFLCFILYAAFDLLAELPVFGTYNEAVMLLGLQEHYRSISRGVVDTRDALYFLSVIFLFLSYSQLALTLRRT